jgi:glycosyltransferase involved in cell wall biosynthesis
MTRPKVLLVTLPNDLGSRTIEANLVRLVGTSCDFKIFRFAPEVASEIDQGVDRRRGLMFRIRNAIALRRAVSGAVRDERTVLFYNVSPAMFAYGCWRKGRACITMDWAGRLFRPEPFGIRTVIGWLNERVFRSCHTLLPMTAAMAECLRRDYRIPADRVHLVPSLFDVERFDPGDIQITDKPRVLFVGGDVVRKGGDLLFESFERHLHEKCRLTMTTNAEFPSLEGLTLLKGVRYGTEQHIRMMQQHDILVLPTRSDSGPQVIGEAAAAGLAVLTTKAALGAVHVVNHGVNGFISETPEACIEALSGLLDRPDEIRRMRQASLDHMRTHYSREAIASAYLSAMADRPNTRP